MRMPKHDQDRSRRPPGKTSAAGRQRSGGGELKWERGPDSAASVLSILADNRSQ